MGAGLGGSAGSAGYEGRVELDDKVVERVENCESVGEEKKGIFISCAKRRRRAISDPER